MSVIRVDGPARLYIGAMARNELSATWEAYEEFNPEDYVDSSVPGFVAPPFQALGITESGVQISVTNSMQRVNADAYGGSEGTPAEFVMMGATAVVRAVLVRYSPSHIALGHAINGCFSGVEGETFIPGTPYFASNNGFSLLVLGTFARWFFPKCEMATQPREFNVSTTERKTSVSFNAYPVFVNGPTTGSRKGILYKKHANTMAILPECAPYGYGGSLEDEEIDM